MRWPIVGLVVALLVGGSCLAAEAQTPSSLTVQVSTEPPGLDLTATPASATAAVVFYNVQECLVKIDRHGKIVPWLAERWRVTDQKNYTFFLKPGVRFHNGRELKAADVKFVIERAMNPETKHPYPQYYASIGDITVKDDYTITFALKNPDYYVKGLPKLDRVTFRFIADPNAAMAALKAGDVDASLFGLGPEHVTDLKNDDRFTVIVGDTTNDVVMAMNNSLKPFTDVRVRRAITHAVDRPEVLKGVMFGMGKLLGSNVDPLNPYYVDLSRAMPYDVPRAKRLLAEAGYPNGFETTLKVTPMYNYTVRAGEIIAGQLAKAGIQARLEQIEWTQWLSRVWRQSVYDMTIIGHAEAWDIGNYANPRYYFRYDNPKFQETFKQSEVAVSDKARRELYVQMQKQLVEDAPVVFLFMHPRLAVAKKGVQGLWKDLPIPSADLSEVSWAPAK